MKKFFKLCIFFLLISLLTVSAAETPRWISQPIKVYLPDYPYFSRLMKQAFTEWETQSDSLVRFKYVTRLTEADITVQFVDFVTNCSSNHAVGCTHMANRGQNYYKSLITIATKESEVVLNNGIFQQIDKQRPINNIYGVMLHEIGHAIGLDHSYNSKSIMYSIDLPTLQHLTQEDLELLYNKYY